MVIGATAQTVGYIINSPAPPFPVLVLSFAINGFGLALQARKLIAAGNTDDSLAC